MSKLQEIIDSGCAPGIVTDAPKVDHASVYYKAPKGLAEVENEQKWKNGPTRSARDISRYFGMSTDFIRKTWAKPILAIALFCLCFSVRAGQIQPGIVFSDGQTVSAAQLGQLVSSATINTIFISGQPVDPAILGSDTMLIFSPTLNGFYRATFNAAFLQNPTLITGQVEKITPIGADYVIIWDSVSATLEKVSIANLVLGNTNLIAGQPFIQATNLAATVAVPILNNGTNGQTSVSNLFRNFEYSRALTNLQTDITPTNNDGLLIWDSVNGTNKTTTLIGLVTNLTVTTNATHFDSLPIATTSANTSGTNPVVSQVMVSNLVPVTIVYDNLTLTNSYMLYTNKPFGGTGHVEVHPVLVTRNQGVGTSYNINDEIPVALFLNTGDLQAFSYGVNPTNVWFSGRYTGNYVGGADLIFPQREGGNSSAEDSVNHTNFFARVYVTYYPPIQ